MKEQYLIVNLIVCFLLFGVLLFIHTQNSPKKLRRIFICLTLSISFWILSLILNILANKEETALFWVKILHFFIMLIPTFFLHFILAYLKIESQRKKPLYLAYTLGFLLAIFNLITPFFISVRYNPSLNFFCAHAQKLYFLNVLFTVLCLLYAFYILFYSYKICEDKIEKVRRKFLFYSTLIGWLGGISNYLINYGIVIYPLFPLGNLTIGVYIFILAYAILRYQLLDIKIVIKRTLVFALLFAIVYGIVSLLVFWINLWLVR